MHSSDKGVYIQCDRGAHCPYIYTDIHIFTYIYIYIHTHTDIYTYTHIGVHYTDIHIYMVAEVHIAPTALCSISALWHTLCIMETGWSP